MVILYTIAAVALVWAALVALGVVWALGPVAWVAASVIAWRVFRRRRGSARGC